MSGSGSAGVPPGRFDDGRLRVVLCWHMHQPDYRDPRDGSYRFPWTYLHAIKDYTDMAAHLEDIPDARAVVNFSAVLLDQLQDYRAQLGAHMATGSVLRDPLLSALAAQSLPTAATQRLALAQACLRADPRRMIARFVPYARLAASVQNAGTDVDDATLSDLLVWYHLAWMGETVRRTDPRVGALVERGGGYTHGDRRQLLGIIAGLLDAVVGRYRALADTGRLELSLTPYGHPILPLLLDFAAARETLPAAELPQAGHYPGGAERARRHIDAAIEVFRREFGRAPQGCWPAEGAVSAAALELLRQAGFRWTASGEQVLRNSLGAQAGAGIDDILCHTHRWSGTLSCFFRRDDLSDLIGFRYAEWAAEQAVDDVLARLERMAAACAAPGRGVATIILDGENAWEHYADNGYQFLRELYARLAAHPRLKLSTFSEALDAGIATRELTHVTAGSWVYGTLSTWIGDAGRNRTWDRLCAVKSSYDSSVAAGRLSGVQRAAADRRLALCESSDWFWWLGQDKPARARREFEELFELNIDGLRGLLDTDAGGVADAPSRRESSHDLAG